MSEQACGRCWKCREGRGCIHTVSIAPSATPSRKNHVAPRQPDPAWERGVVTDNRGMPQLNDQFMPMGVKEHQGQRSRLEEQKRKHQQVPAKLAKAT